MPIGIFEVTLGLVVIAGAYLTYRYYELEYKSKKFMSALKLGFIRKIAKDNEINLEENLVSLGFLQRITNIDKLIEAKVLESIRKMDLKAVQPTQPVQTEQPTHTQLKPKK
jgi:hypothetical protein